MGLLGFYTGFRYHLVRDTFGTGFYFSTYYTFRRILSERSLLSSVESESTTESFNGTNENSVPMYIYALSGALCGALSMLVIFPLDTAKNIVQRNIVSKSIGAPISETFPPVDKHGRQKSSIIQAFYRRRMYNGLLVTIFRSVLVNSTGWFVFEGMRRYAFDIDF